MTFNEFTEKYDRYHAFTNFLTVETAKTMGLIPEDYHEYFPNKCKCGSDNIITMGLQQPQCCNPRCYIKQGYALSELFTRFKCKGLGPARCIEIIQCLSPKFKYNSYLEILNMTMEDFPVNLAQKAYAFDLLDAIHKIKSETITFPALIGNLAIPTLGDRALKLLEGIDSFEEFQNEIKKCGTLQLFCDSRGIHDQMVLFWIRNSAIDMCIADIILQGNIRRSGIVKIEICITGFLYLNGKRITKDEFIKVCNQLTVNENGVQLFEIVQNTAKISASHIIADTPSRSAKYLAGLKRGKEIDIDGVERNVLMTSAEFLEFLKEMKLKWEKKQKQLEESKGSQKVQKTKMDLF